VQGAIPFTVAASPILYSYLVWQSDYTMTGGPNALHPDLQWSRPPLHEMEELLSRGTITADSFIVVFASNDQPQGAFVAWMLHMMGFEVRYLDGGGRAWNDAGHPTGGSGSLNAAGDADPSFRVPNYDTTSALADLDMVIHAAQNPEQWAIVDTRTYAELAGDTTFGGAFGYGSIAGAYYINWIYAFHDQNEDNTMLPQAQLREVFADVLDGRSVIVYCHGGLRSAHTWHVLRSLGVDVYNYDGSWIEWSYVASNFSSHPQSTLVQSLTENWYDRH